MARRAVITGLGTVSALGVGAGALWEGLEAGRTGIRRLTRFDGSTLGCELAGEAEFSAKDAVPKGYRKAVKVMARDIELAVGAAKLAVEDAGVMTRGGEEAGAAMTYPSERMGCQIGAGLIAAETDELSSALATSVGADGGWDLKAWGTVEAAGGKSGMNNLQPLWLLKYLPNMLACHVTIIHGCEGPSNTITCGEASGILSLGEAARVIERDAADLCLAGGAESKINLMGFLRMKLAGRLAEARAEESGAGLVRPYAPEARGSVLGEAGGILVLEEEGRAKARGARRYARIAGFGAAHGPPPAYAALAGKAARRGGRGGEEGLGTGVRYAVEAALKDAGIGADAIDAVVPHGAGVAALDQEELAGLRAVFGERLDRTPLVAVVPAVGECSAGLGAVQAAVGARALGEQRLPTGATIGSDGRAWKSAGAAIRYILVVCHALGGQNGVLVLERAG